MLLAQLTRSMFCYYGRARSAGAGKIIRNSWTENKVLPLRDSPWADLTDRGTNAVRAQTFPSVGMFQAGGYHTECGEWRASSGIECFRRWSYFVRNVDNCITEGESIHTLLDWNHNSDSRFQPLLLIT